MNQLPNQDNNSYREGDTPQDKERLVVTQCGLLSASITLVSILGLGTIGVPLISITGLGAIGLGLTGFIMCGVDHVNSTDHWEYLDSITTNILPAENYQSANSPTTNTVEVSHQTIIPQVESNFNQPVQPVAAKPSMIYMSGNSDNVIPESTAVKPSFSSVSTNVIETFVPQLEPIDVSLMLAEKLYSNAIMSPSGGGKGMLVSNALRKIKELHPNIHIFLVDPKDDPKERGYWEGVVNTWCRCDFNSMRSQAKTDFLEGVLDKYHSIQGPKLLVFDEATNVFGHLKNCSKYLLAEVKSFLSGIASSGNSRDNFVWLVGHSGNLGDYGISGGEMSCFRKIYIAPMSNIEAIKQLGNTTFAGGKFGAEGVEYIKQVALQSEVTRAVYIGTIDSWEPMAKLVNHSGYDRDNHVFSEVKAPVKSDKSNFNQFCERAMSKAIESNDIDLYLEVTNITESGESVKGLVRLQEICLQVD